MPQRREVHANLVRAAGLEAERQVRRASRNACAALVVRDGRLAVAHDRVLQAVVRIAADRRRRSCPLSCSRNAGDEAEIFAFDARAFIALPSAESVASFFATTSSPGRVAIEPVDQAGAQFGSPGKRPDVREQRVDQRAVGAPCAGCVTMPAGLSTTSSRRLRRRSESRSLRRARSAVRGRRPRIRGSRRFQADSWRVDRIAVDGHGAAFDRLGDRARARARLSARRTRRCACRPPQCLRRVARLEIKQQRDADGDARVGDVEDVRPDAGRSR